VLKADALTDATELGRSVSLLDAELANARLGVRFAALRLAEILFVEMLRKSQLLPMPPAFLAALADPAVSAALTGIHRHRRALRADELAREAGISRAVFFERFHRLVGETPQRYARAWRLLQARRALLRGAVPMSKAAAAAGYASSAGFSRAFRRQFGHRPSRLREP
jgi:AraC-like DNA-binding protein